MTFQQGKMMQFSCHTCSEERGKLNAHKSGMRLPTYFGLKGEVG